MKFAIKGKSIELGDKWLITLVPLAVYLFAYMLNLGQLSGYGVPFWMVRVDYTQLPLLFLILVVVVFIAGMLFAGVIESAHLDLQKIDDRRKINQIAKLTIGFSLGSLVALKHGGIVLSLLVIYLLTSAYVIRAKDPFSSLSNYPKRQPSSLSTDPRYLTFFWMVALALMTMLGAYGVGLVYSSNRDSYGVIESEGHCIILINYSGQVICGYLEAKSDHVLRQEFRLVNLEMAGPITIHEFKGLIGRQELNQQQENGL